jgi:hypothetical protein
MAAGRTPVTPTTVSTMKERSSLRKKPRSTWLIIDLSSKTICLNKTFEKKPRFLGIVAFVPDYAVVKTKNTVMFFNYKFISMNFHEA